MKRDPEWKQQRWPEIKKKPKKRGRAIVFIDESGLSQRPHRCRTWAPTGPNPGAAISLQLENVVRDGRCNVVELLLPTFSGSIRSPQVVEFLSHLLRQSRQAARWFGTAIVPCSRAIWEFVRQQHGRFGWNFFPPMRRN